MPALGLRTLAGLIVFLGVSGAAHATGLPLAAQPRESHAGLPSAPVQPLRFDMARQPLQAALEQFHRITGQSLLYDSALVKGKMADPLRGRLTPEAALRSMLSGTGIEARYTSDMAFVLVRPSSLDGKGRERPAASSASVSGRKRAYFSHVQGRVEAALCGDSAARPGAYGLALSLWIGADRRVDRVALHSTGNAGRDERIRERLTGLPLASLPPADLRQPITLLILPRPSAYSGDCADADGAP
ncbi:STN domain-containing protein [Pollutimonas bauzanensis]|uniref:Secretin/TonB short N-terminal domain-containing protein n=1 Tax=Pollutimonas bauzanensis TaxID=658167 RepID=A0A1M5ZLM7_9BURK|nr:STN domain-containing protein [Pollutimonas bauzanensis]SHI25255.1 hypothetical protein SAMN04488135_11612 [Pollutimonas bauzanensis]